MKRNKVFGIGVVDIKTVDLDGKTLKAYQTWKAMLGRCYSESVKASRPTYEGCEVVHTWTIFSNFKKWFDVNYVDGYHLDKDLLSKDNKIYCAQYCRFVPPYINTLIAQKYNASSGLPGVTWAVQEGKWKAQIFKDSKKLHLGYYSDKLDAFEVYCIEKESQIKKIAINAYEKGHIDVDILQSLLKYEVKR